MIVAKIFFWIIGIMFFAGAIGSSLVVIFTTVDDIKDLSGNGETEPQPAPIVTQTGSHTH
jgi:hypothetical protein